MRKQNSNDRSHGNMLEKVSLALGVLFFSLACFAQSDKLSPDIIEKWKQEKARDSENVQSIDVCKVNPKVCSDVRADQQRIKKNEVIEWIVK